MKTLKQSSIYLLILLMLLSLFGCGRKEYLHYEVSEEPQLLVDFFKKITGTEIDRGFEEITLSPYSDKQAQMDVFTQADGDSETVHLVYLVSLTAVDDAKSVLEGNDMVE